MLEKSDLEAIKARADAATPGRWFWTAETDYDPGRIVGEPMVGGFGEPEWDVTPDDAEFIAHAREDVPALLAHIDALTADNERLQRIEAAALRCESFWKHRGHGYSKHALALIAALHPQEQE
jgi:hypothetical protein